MTGGAVAGVSVQERATVPINTLDVPPPGAGLTTVMV